MMKNAQRLHANPGFRQDMLLTVEISLEKMRRFMNKTVNRIEEHLRLTHRSPQRLAVLCVIAGLWMAGCSGDSEVSLLSSAKKALEKRDFNSAIIQSKTVLQRNAQSGEARLLLGRALLESGDARSAVLELEKALALKRSDDEVLPGLAQALVDSGQAKKATEKYGSTALSQPIAAAELQVALALAWAAQGVVDRSEAATLSALKSDPKNKTARLLEAKFAANKGAVDPALALVNKLVADEPRFADAWHFKGELLRFSKRDASGAAEAYKAALAVDPKSAPIYVSLATLALEQGDLKLFKQRADEFNKAVPNHFEARMFAAQVALMENNLKGAREIVQRLLGVAPDNARILQLSGVVEAAAGSLNLAETQLKRAIQLAPNVPAARQALAALHLRSGQAANALAVLEPLLRRPVPGALVQGLAGEAFLQLGDLAKAEEHFARAAKADPADPRAGTAVALTRIGRGQVDAGFSQLESLAASDSGTYADLALISARLRRNELDDALKALDGLQAKMAGKPLPHQIRANILARRGDAAGARSNYEKAAAADPIYFPAVAALATLDLADNKPEDARKRFEILLQRDPRNVDALLALADLKKRIGAPSSEVAAMLVEASKLVPGDVRPKLVLIEVYLSMRNNKGALAAAQEAAAAFPSNAVVLDSLGRTQLAAGDLQQAVTTFGKLAALQPTAPEPYLRIAQAFMQAKDYAAATRSLNRALEITPNLLAAQRGLIQAATAGKNIDAALAVARQVQKQRPKESVGYVMEAEIQSSQRKWDPAIASLKAALAIDKSTESATRLHGAYRSAGRLADAQRFAAAWTRERPNDAAFHNFIGTVAMVGKDYAAAEVSFRSVLKLKDNDPQLLNNLAWVLLQQGKAEAVQFAERANVLDPNRGATMDTLAGALAAANQLPSAIDWQRKAVERAPDVPGYRLSLAKMLVKAGNKSAARAELESLAKLGSKFSAQSEVTALLASL